MNKRKQRSENTNVEQTFLMRKYFLSTCFIIVIFTVWGILLFANQRDDIKSFTMQGWGTLSSVIVKNRLSAIWHLVGLAVLFVGYLWLVATQRVKKKWKIVATALLVIVVGLDALWLSDKYIKEMSPTYIQSNAVTEVIRNHIGTGRTAMSTQEGFYNIWLTYLFPYHNIPSFNITQMPRMSQDYKNFLSVLGRNPLRMWQLSAVNILLGPRGLTDALAKSQPTQGLVEELFSYNIMRAEKDGFTIVPGNTQYPAQHAIFKLNWVAPRYALIGGAEILPRKEILSKLISPSYWCYERVLLSDDSCLPLSGSGIVGKTTPNIIHDGEIRIETQCETPAILRVADKYDPAWKAWVDGKPTSLLCVDYLFQGVYVSAGKHQVRLAYAPPIRFLWVQIGGLFLFIISILYLVVRGMLNKVIFHKKERQETIQ